MANASPMIQEVGTGPQNRLSSDSPRLSPIMNQCPGGILIGCGKLQASSLGTAQGLMYGSDFFFPLTIGWPSTIESVSPGPATIRLMKLVSDGLLFGLGQAS